MTIQLIIFILILVAVIIFYKSFTACVCFVVLADIFLRLVTYLKTYIIRADAFDFLNFIPESVLAIISSFNIGILNDILMILYITMFIIFEALLIRMFIKRKF